MQFILSKTGIATILLLGVFVFGYFMQSGVFGSTTIGKLIETNPSLENGLVAHFTFDSSDFDASSSTAEIIDSFGSNNGNFVVASTSAEVEVDDTTNAADDDLFWAANPNMVWVDQNVGYVFYSDAGSDVHMSSTTDGGATWGTSVNVDSVNTSDAMKAAVWYDAWTPNSTTSQYIHIVTADISTDDLYYTRYDTTSDTFSTTVVTGTQSASYSDSETWSITKSTDGDLYVAAASAADAFVHVCGAGTDCTSTGNWSEATSAYETNEIVPSILLPITGTNNVGLLVAEGSSGDDIYINVYSATSSSWWGVENASTTATFHGPGIDSGMSTISAVVHPIDGDIYLAYTDDDENFVTEDHKISLYRYDVSTFDWVYIGNPLDDVSGGLVAINLMTDEKTGDLYLTYIRRTTIGTASTANIYYIMSTDSGATWTSESVIRQNDHEQEIHGLTGSYMSPGRLAVGYKYIASPEEDDYHVKTIVDLSQRETVKTRPGALGQSLSFDGIDDHVALTDETTFDFTTDMTVALWMKMDSDTDVFGCIVCKSDDQAWNLQRGTNNNVRLGLSGTTGSEDVVSEFNSLNFGEWMHVVATYDGTNAIMYLDGVLSSSSAVTGSIGNSAFDVSIGEDLQTSNLEFKGEIDDVRIYNRALSAEEASRLHDLGATTQFGVTQKINPNLEDGLVLHLSFDADTYDRSNTGNEFLDETGVNFGNWINHNYTITPGVLGQGVELDGDNDFINSGSDTSLDLVAQKTLAMWIRIRGDIASPYEELITKDDGCGGDGSWYWYIDNTDSLTYDHCFDSNGGSWEVDSQYSFEADRWYHVAVSFDLTSVANDPVFYIDGESVTFTEDNVPAGSNGAGEETDDLRIGADASGNEFGGDIDDVRFYNRLLSASEVKRLYQLGATTKIGVTLDNNSSLDEGLIVHYTFDGKDVALASSTNEILDRSSANEDGDWFNHSSTTRPGKIGQALDFDGTDDYIEISGANAYNNDLDTFTYAAWIKPEGWGGGSEGKILTSTASSAVVGVQMRVHNSGAPLGSLRGYVNSDGGTDASVYTDAGSISLNEWAHVVMTYDDAGDRTIRFYKNGVEMGYDSNTAATAAMIDANGTLWIGDENDGSTGDEVFDGLIDDVRVYNRVLSTTEIQQLYELGG